MKRLLVLVLVLFIMGMAPSRSDGHEFAYFAPAQPIHVSTFPLFVNKQSNINNYDVTKYKMLDIPDLQPYKGMIRPLDKALAEGRKAYLVLSKKSPNIKDKPAMIEKINNTLTQMKAEGVLDKIYYRYWDNKILWGF